MKKYIIPAFCLALVFSSCCKKVDCADLHSFSVRFHDFSREEVDTIYTTAFRLGSGFSDTALAVTRDTTEFANGYASLLHDFVTGGYETYGEPLTDLYEWELFIPSVNRTVRISNYGYRTYRCSNGCGFRRGKETKSLSTCVVDGKVLKSAEIGIYK